VNARPLDNLHAIRQPLQRVTEKTSAPAQLFRIPADRIHIRDSELFFVGSPIDAPILRCSASQVEVFLIAKSHSILRMFHQSENPEGENARWQERFKGVS
jgi:hypothetical protein